MPRRKQDAPKRMKWEEGEQKDGANEHPQQQEPEESRVSSSSVSSPPPPPEDMADMCGVEAPPSDLPIKMEPLDPEPADADEPMDEPMAPIDFSLKRSLAQEDDSEGKMSENESSAAAENGALSDSQDSPLDLSMSHKKSSNCPRASKLARLEKNIDKIMGPWKSGSAKPHHNSFKNLDDPHLWNGKPKIKQEKSISSSINALNSITNPSYNLLNSKVYSGRDKLSIKSENSRQSNRQNPWQTQWMSRSSEQTKDVFTCVWCKESFRSLQEMTYHMKQSIRCGMAGIQASIPPSSPSPTLSTQQNVPTPASSKASHLGTSSSASNTTLLIKESMPLPRKLVRGQDVWLGKGAEQTRQILKCMWCGQSFKTLADMTTHMRVTQHYTNIISQEQIISWRSPEDKLSTQSQVNAVLTCKVCDQAFGSLKELSTHMEKNSHYKEHILRSITEGGGRRRQTRERRKKSLPVRKLLEIERMELNKQGGKSRPDSLDGSLRTDVIDGKITCEECAEKVDAKDFVQHIKNCNHGSKTQQYLKNMMNSESSESKEEHDEITSAPPEETPMVNNPSSKSPEVSSNVSSPKNEEKPPETKNSDNSESSVLNAIERLIEKSFESKGRKHPTTKGILQRLGIDEEVCPPWYPSNSPSKHPMMNKSNDLNYKPSSPIRNYSSHDELSRKSPLVPSSFHLSEDALGSGRSRVSTPSSLTSPSIPGSPSSNLESSFKERTSSPQTVKSPMSPSSSPSRMPDISNSKQADKSGEEVLLPAPEDLRSSPHEFSQGNEPRTDSSPPHLEPEDEVSTTNDCHDDSSLADSEPEPRDQEPSNSSAKRKSSQEPSDHPLKQLQKLLDKTDAHLSRPGLPSNPGSILAFSWACNDAATTADSFMKCAFCETHFVSKGAYRHHLSKMHFVKDSVSEKTTADSTSWRSDASPKDSPNSSSTPQGESPHTKFLKYTELAKQLSSKYV